MCGIAGFITSGVPASEDLLKRMCDRMIHRGPDGYGTFVKDNVALGHRRLSIIDLAGGAQPISNEDGTIQVVFNGEIYNYLELRRDLLARGHEFRTQSDTEVLVHLYEEEGERLPELLSGMFAFAIWDSRKRQLFLARDRFGEKPLYYAENMGSFQFCFASELKALAVLPDFRQSINPHAVSDFLCLSYIPDPLTIYDGVAKLPAAHRLTVGPTGARMDRYWDPSFAVNNQITLDEAAGRIRQLAGQSVRRQMISDVPLGAFLSGGVDSSAVVALMALSGASEVKSFSIGFTTEGFDELPYARQVAERYRTSHHEHVVTPHVHDVLSTLVEHYDEPFADSSAVATLYVSRMTREHVTVALSGDGGDELFGGYRRYRFAILEDRIRHLFPQWFRESFIAYGAKVYPQFETLPRPLRAKATLRGISQTLADAYFSAMTGFRDGAAWAIFSDDLRRGLNGYCTRQSFRDRFAAVRHLDPLKQLQAVDIQTYLPGDIFVKVDRASMAYSLETRAPLLDPCLAQFAFSLPQSFALRGGGKLAFKRAVAPLLPESILTRAKMGFVVPLGEWFRTTLRQTFQDLVLSDRMSGLISIAEARRLWQIHQSGRRDVSRHLWSLLMLACWFDKHYQSIAPVGIAESMER